MTSARKLSSDNVVPFARPRVAESRTPDVVPSRNVARDPTNLIRDRIRLAAFVALSLAVHAGLLASAWRDPVPLASIGLEVISVEITVGAMAPAGVAATPGESQVQSAAAPDEKAHEPEQTEQKATEQPQTVEVAKQETASEQKNEPEARDEPKPAVAMIESPAPEIPTAAQRATPPPDTTELSLLPQPEEKPAEPKIEPKPVEVARPQPVKKNAAPAREQRRIAAPTREKAAREAKASTPSSQASNVGVGRSDSDTNYAGLVSAHLRRHQQYPSDARSRGDQGTATVTFSLDGGGRVTSARLVRGSGIASIDQEVQAMVRRASPFPAPPASRSLSFTVPVSFRLN